MKTVAPAIPLPIAIIDAVAGVLAAVAWPVSILLIFVIFRKQVRDFLDHVIKFRWGSAEVELDRERAQAEAGASIIEGLVEERQVAAPSKRTPLSAYYAERVTENPLNAILEAYIAIERWFDDALTTHGLSQYQGTRKLSVTEMTSEAVKAGLLPSTIEAPVKAMTILRNVHLHEGAGLTVEDAQQFLTAADGVLYLLDTELAKHDDETQH